MRQEFLTPAAILAQSILKSVEKHHSTFTADIVASAFLEAYRAVEQAELEEKKTKGKP